MGRCQTLLELAGSTIGRFVFQLVPVQRFYRSASAVKSCRLHVPTHPSMAHLSVSPGFSGGAGSAIFPYHRNQLVVPDESPLRDRPEEEKVALRLGALDKVSLEADERTELEREKQARWREICLVVDVVVAVGVTMLLLSSSRSPCFGDVSCSVCVDVVDVVAIAVAVAVVDVVAIGGYLVLATLEVAIVWMVLF